MPETDPVQQSPFFIENFRQLHIYRAKTIIKLATVNWFFSTWKQK